MYSSTNRLWALLFLLSFSSAYAQPQPEPEKKQSKDIVGAFTPAMHVGLLGGYNYIYDHAAAVDTTAKANLSGLGLSFLWYFRPRTLISADLSMKWLNSLKVGDLELDFIGQTYYPLRLLLYYLPAFGKDRFGIGGGFELFFAGNRRNKTNNNIEAGSAYTDIFLQMAAIYVYPIPLALPDKQRLSVFGQASFGLNVTPGDRRVATINEQQTLSFQLNGGVLFRIK